MQGYKVASKYRPEPEKWFEAKTKPEKAGNLS